MRLPSAAKTYDLRAITDCTFELEDVYVTVEYIWPAALFVADERAFSLNQLVNL